MPPIVEDALLPRTSRLANRPIPGAYQRSRRKLYPVVASLCSPVHPSGPWLPLLACGLPQASHRAAPVNVPLPSLLARTLPSASVSG